MIHEITLSIDEICEWIPDDSDQQLTRSILEMFEKYDLTYKINTDDERLRIYCYIKKSKETLIINTKGYRYGEFDIQMRITNRAALEKLDEYSEHIREQIINADNCRKCWNCGKEYVFTYQGTEYRKCCMLCNNFTLHRFSAEDCDTVLRMIYEEICFSIPKQKRHLLDKQ